MSLFHEINVNLYQPKGLALVLGSWNSKTLLVDKSNINKKKKVEKKSSLCTPMMIFKHIAFQT